MFICISELERYKLLGLLDKDIKNKQELLKMSDDKKCQDLVMETILIDENLMDKLKGE